MHWLPVASSRDFKSDDMWLGWTDQVLGLIHITLHQSLHTTSVHVVIVYGLYCILL